MSGNDARDMTSVFDAYVMVDWSASGVPNTGANSIWYCCLERTGDGGMRSRNGNPDTRHKACAELSDLLSDLVARDRTVLAGFDFAFGYPRGFAGRLRPDAPTWKSVWKEIAGRVRDGENNANNRFEVAASLNDKVSGRAFPFWGCPGGAEGPGLTRTRPADFGNEKIAEYRLADRVTNGPQPVWKLHYPGSVGSQTLLGIAVLQKLRHHPWLAEHATVWPFETGLKTLSRSLPREWRLLMAEVYPSMIPVTVQPGEVRDAAQVRSLARYFAGLDEAGKLAGLFAGPADLDEDQRQVIETEEGWILGIETGGKRGSATDNAADWRDYLRDPEEIYRRSFASIRAETDLTSLPEALRPVVVRLVHACGEPGIIGDLAYSDGAAEAGRRALADGAPILVDATMVAAGVIRKHLPAANSVICTLNEPGVAEHARERKTTRSAAAVDLWRPHLNGAVVAIGNAPTALFRLLELIDQGADRPAVVLAFPVGFIGAAESKQALIDYPDAPPYLTLRGRRGGSAFAAAAVNALAGGAS